MIHSLFLQTFSLLLLAFADIAHAYQTLIRRGVPAKHIVVIMYDDVAHNPLNPKKNQLINRPGGPNVYKGLKIDYKGKNVTPKVFLDVLSGNKKAVKGKGTGRVIESGPKDHVFVNIVSDGGPGLICFPSETLHVKDLAETLNKLTKKKRYGKMVFYVESCEGGSNFDQFLPEKSNILVSSSSAIDEQSWSAYCKVGSYPCLGSAYSVSWLEHLDKKLLPNENFFQQYESVRVHSKGSHVELYGNFQLGADLVKDFLGPHNIPAKKDNSHWIIDKGWVPTRDSTIHYYERMAKIAKNHFIKNKYKKLANASIREQHLINKTVDSIVDRATKQDDNLLYTVNYIHSPLTHENVDSYTRVSNHFIHRCFDINKKPYALKHFYKLLTLCDKGYEKATMEAINHLCNEKLLFVTDTE